MTSRAYDHGVKVRRGDAVIATDKEDLVERFQELTGVRLTSLSSCCRVNRQRLDWISQ